ncbi:hypothetical protein M2102_000546 [Fusobacterium sp. PH5-7]|uniref:hypothetical protein n=1 Tax=Fusobacterium sp. PH5-7 TaxID=2940528 RepID=UPI002473B71C|nr:hypothetical protein [Fusobacterium sp. PH5-7]MDH6456931.1 hypothetical protein [Fusobacterium sp. PH5-7]
MIKKMCELANDYILSPFNLVDNARLENYEYVKYYSDKNDLVCEMKFEILSEKYIFYYYFDKKDKLQKIYAKEDEKERYLFFDRKENLEKEIIKYKKIMNKEKAC